MNLKKGAFSPDGFIISQKNTADVKYGKKQSSYNGCGWISAYNLMRSLGVNATPAEVHASLQQGLMFGGRFGTGPRRLRKWLKARGIETKTAMRKKKAAALAQQSRAGIIMYFNGFGLHYVAYKKDKEGRQQFWNAADGDENHKDSMQAFIKKHAKLPIVYLLAVC